MFDARNLFAACLIFGWANQPGLSSSCAPYNGTQCLGWTANFSSAVSSATKALDNVIEEIMSAQPLWVATDCQEAIRKVSCLGLYAAYTCDFTYCQEDCVDLLTPCSSYFTLSNSTAVLEKYLTTSFCGILNSSTSCLSNTYSLDRYTQDECVCAKPLYIKPTEVSSSCSVRSVPYSGCAMQCRGYVYTKPELDHLGMFGVAMSVGSLILTTWVLWLFLSEQDALLRRTAVVDLVVHSSRKETGAAPSLGRHAPDDVDRQSERQSESLMGEGLLMSRLSFMQSVRQTLSAASSRLSEAYGVVREGRLLKGYSKAQLWKVLLFGGAWINALVSLAYDSRDLASPIGCHRNSSVGYTHNSFSATKAFFNFWVHLWSVSIMAYLSRYLYYSALGRPEIGARMEREFWKVASAIFAATVTVSASYAICRKYGYDWGTSTAFILQTDDATPLWVMVALLGAINVVATAYVVGFIRTVTWRNVPDTAKTNVYAFLIYYAVMFCYIGLSIHVFRYVKTEHIAPATADLISCYLANSVTSTDTALEVCGSHISREDRPSWFSSYYFKMWQSGFSIFSVLAWSPLVFRKFRHRAIRRRSSHGNNPIHQNANVTDEPSQTPRETVSINEYTKIANSQIRMASNNQGEHIQQLIGMRPLPMPELPAAQNTTQALTLESVAEHNILHDGVTSPPVGEEEYRSDPSVILDDSDVEGT